MVPRQSFINKLHQLKYTYKTQQKRTTLWRKIGGTHRISLPLSEMLTDEYVTSTLKQAGCQDAEIRTFLASAKC